ncbi:MAG: hypothetical protein M1814_006418 [Vezdaea aestivalis]|nr:MAG: hypothetical protein M1814_006418 [Vezdaea aestivalis]
MNWKGDVRSSPGPPSQFKTKLKNNAFAQALATPIRQCALTKARLPNAFLVEFTQRLHPDTMLPWLLPTDMRHVDRRAASRTPKKPIEYPTILNPSIEKGYVSNRVSVLKIANAMGRKGHHSSLEIWKKITHRHTESAQMPLGKTVWRPDMDSFISRLLRNRVLEEITALTDLSDEYLRSYKDPFCKVRFKSDVAVALRLSGWEADQNGKLPLAELGYQQRVNEKDNIPVLIYNLPKMGDDKWIAKLQEALKLDHSVEVISLKRSWGTLEPEKEIMAKLVFVHGFSDHCNAYYKFFPTLAARKIQVLAFDQRGWGRSCSSLRSSHKGLTGPSSQVYADITSFLRSVLPPVKSSEDALERVHTGSSDKEPDEIPVFLMGHSMGGAEIICYSVHGPLDILAQIRGYLAESPLIALHPEAEPTKFKNTLLRAVLKIMPWLQQKQQLDGNFMCRDPQVIKDWEEDALCHDTGTLDGLAGMLDRAEELRNGQVEGRAMRGVWIGHGTDDRITMCQASEEWFKRCKSEDKTLRLYDGWYHKLHGEPGQDRVTFYNDVGDWILERSQPILVIKKEDEPEAKAKL